MRRSVLIVAVILSLFVCIPANAGPVRGAVKLAAKSAKVVKVVMVVKGPLRFAAKVLPPYHKHNK